MKLENFMGGGKPKDNNNHSLEFFIKKIIFVVFYELKTT
jgi:hypothetical protein